jgi:excisionase family DNA binding protein
MDTGTIYNKRVLTTIEAATFLGISKAYLYRLTSAGVVPYSKPNGKKLFFDREALEMWMLQNATPGNHVREAMAVTHLNTTR